MPYQVKMKIQRKNKRGSIPIAILVLGVLLVCTLALTSFYLSERNVKKNFDVLNIVSIAKLVGEKAIVYQNLGYTKEQADKMLGITVDSTGRYYLVREGKITVKYYIP